MLGKSISHKVLNLNKISSHPYVNYYLMNSFTLKKEKKLNPYTQIQSTASFFLLKLIATATQLVFIFSLEFVYSYFEFTGS